MDGWKVMVEPTRRTVRLLVTDPEHNELLKAALPSWPRHPRALLTSLEGLAMWAGQPVIAVVSAGPSADAHSGAALFGDGLLTLDSALVRFDLAPPLRRRRTIAGVGDFRHLRLVQRRLS